LSELSATLIAVDQDERATGRLLERQRGLITRSQAIAMGLTESALRHRLRADGPWRQVLPGIYLTVSDQPSRQQRDMAAALYAGQTSAVTGPSALRFWQLSGPKPSRVDVLIPAERQRASRDFVQVHRTRLMPQQVAADGPLGYVLPARAVIDTVRGMTQLADVRAVVAGAVQDRRCRVDDLQAELRSGPIKGTAMVRKVLAEVAAGIRSAPEADLRCLLIDSPLPMPLFNCSLRLNGKFLAKPDAYWPDHGVAVEVDSWQWHSGPEEWVRTWQRHNRLEVAGLRVLHFSPRELRSDPARVLRQIAAALAHGRPVTAIAVTAAA